MPDLSRWCVEVLVEGKVQERDRVRQSTQQTTDVPAPEKRKYHYQDSNWDKYCEPSCSVANTHSEHLGLEKVYTEHALSSNSAASGPSLLFWGFLYVTDALRILQHLNTGERVCLSA